MIIAVVTLAAALVGSALLISRRPADAWLLESRLKRRAIVTLKSGDSFAGVLFEVDAAALVLREATALAFGPRSENVIVDGEALLLRGDVAYIQFT